MGRRKTASNRKVAVTLPGPVRADLERAEATAAADGERFDAGKWFQSCASRGVAALAPAGDTVAVTAQIEGRRAAVKFDLPAEVVQALLVAEGRAAAQGQEDFDPATWLLEALERGRQALADWSGDSSEVGSRKLWMRLSPSLAAALEAEETRTTEKGLQVSPYLGTLALLGLEVDKGRPDPTLARKLAKVEKDLRALLAEIESLTARE